MSIQTTIIQDRNAYISYHINMIAQLKTAIIIFEHKNQKIDKYNFDDIKKSLIRNPQWIAKIKRETGL